MKYAATVSLVLAATVAAVPTSPKNDAIIVVGGSGVGLAGTADNANTGVANSNANNGNANTGAGTAVGASGGATGGTAVSAATQQQVAGTIQQWLNDIATVNNFVDTAGQLTDAQQISDFASQTFIAAQDEGTSNTALQQAVQLDASGLSAAQDLLNQFNIIGPAINDTISNPQNLQKNLDAINGARCPPPAGNGAIFEEGAVQQSAATAAGLQAPLPALPNACGQLAQAVLASQQGQNGNANANANANANGNGNGNGNANSNDQGNAGSAGAQGEASNSTQSATCNNQGGKKGQGKGKGK